MNRVWLVLHDNGLYEAPSIRSIHATKDLADTAARPDIALGHEIIIEEWEVKGCSD